MYFDLLGIVAAVMPFLRDFISLWRQIVPRPLPHSKSRLMHDLNAANFG
jgi:hypothetical protein